MKPILLIRCDAGSRIGAGHAMRMLALAQSWMSKGGVARFACAEIPTSIKERIEGEGMAVEPIHAAIGSPSDAEQTCRLLNSFNQRGAGGTCFALDGYQFDSRFQRDLKQTGCRLLVVHDDGRSDPQYADIILNQNLGAKPASYPHRQEGARLLLGPEYSLLRREFSAYRSWNRTIPKRAKKVLITFGGSDPDNVTWKVVEQMARFEIQAKVVIGGGNPHLETITRAVQGLSKASAKFEIVCNVKDMPSLMAWADMAVTAGGSTSWELAFLGLPSLVFVLADNQWEIAQALDSMGVVVSLGRADTCPPSEFQRNLEGLMVDFEKRVQFSKLGRELVDGLGAERVCEAFRS